MANKEMKARVQQKIDTSTNWAKATNFIPLKGEIIVYSDTKQIKIGDGTTKVNSLPYIGDEKANKKSLATVATSGDYEDLSNKPNVPSLSQYFTTVDDHYAINTVGFAELAKSLSNI